MQTFRVPSMPRHLMALATGLLLSLPPGTALAQPPAEARSRGEPISYAEPLAEYVLQYERMSQRRNVLTCAPDAEQPEPARVGPARAHGVSLTCRPVFTEPPPLLSFIQRSEGAGRFTLDGVEGGDGAVGLLGKGLVYQTPDYMALVVSVFHLSPRRWRPGQWTVREETTGRAVPVLAARVDVREASSVLGAVGLLGLVIAAPPSPTERYVLEVLEQDDNPRRVRLEGLTFGR